MSMNMSWINISFAETHKYEFLIESLLNEHLFQYGMRALRIGNNKYSPYDIDIYSFDTTNLTYGNVIIHVDVERKSVMFPEAPAIPVSWKLGVNFLRRKVEKLINRDIDVYMLFDNSDKIPRIIWTTYGVIRNVGIRFSHNEFRGEVYVITKSKIGVLNFGIESFVDYTLSCIENKPQP